MNENDFPALAGVIIGPKRRKIVSERRPEGKPRIKDCKSGNDQLCIRHSTVLADNASKISTLSASSKAGDPGEVLQGCGSILGLA